VDPRNETRDNGELEVFVVAVVINGVVVVAAPMCVFVVVVVLVVGLGDGDTDDKKLIKFLNVGSDLPGTT
jgi:hypothetical protein